MAGVNAYHRLVPAFEALFEREGCDFAAFYQAAEVMGRMPPAEREAQLRALPTMGNPSMLAHLYSAPSEQQ